MCSLLAFEGVAGRCDRCGAELTGRKARWCSRECHNAWISEHIWGEARRLARRRDHQRCVQCGAAAGPRPLEVNHIEPRVGQGYGIGCWNHLDNLETLCHDCHLVVTAAQVAARQEAARPADLALF